MAHTATDPVNSLVERISAEQAAQNLDSDPNAMLVCADDTEEKCRQNHLPGAISLKEFESRVDSLSKTSEIIFYCA